MKRRRYPEVFYFQRNVLALYSRKTFVLFLLVVSFWLAQHKHGTKLNVYQMLHVLSYQFVDKAKQMDGKRSFHFIVNGYVQSKFHPEAPAAEYRTRAKGQKATSGGS